MEWYEILMLALAWIFLTVIVTKAKPAKTPLDEINDRDDKIASLESELDKVKKDFMFAIGELEKEMDVKIGVKSDELSGHIHYRTITRKLEGWKSEHEFIELYAKIYVLDNGSRKINPPYVVMNNGGHIDKYDKDLGPDTKLRCYMLTKLVLPGYYKPGELSVAVSAGSERNNFEKVFGKSYREIVDLMYEHNYHRVKDEMYTLNFYEI